MCSTHHVRRVREEQEEFWVYEARYRSRQHGLVVYSTHMHAHALAGSGGVHMAAGTANPMPL